MVTLDDLYAARAAMYEAERHITESDKCWVDYDIATYRYRTLLSLYLKEIKWENQ